MRQDACALSTRSPRWWRSCCCATNLCAMFPRKALLKHARQQSDARCIGEANARLALRHVANVDFFFIFFSRRVICFVGFIDGVQKPFLASFRFMALPWQEAGIKTSRRQSRLTSGRLTPAQEPVKSLSTVNSRHWALKNQVSRGLIVVVSLGGALEGKVAIALLPSGSHCIA